ncbi:MAG: GTPase HflX [Bacteriovoracaceae bacterium]
MLTIDEFRIPVDGQATLVSVVCDSLDGHKTEIDTNRSLIELRELLRTLGIKFASQHIQNKKSIESGTFIGAGKVKEIAEAAQAEGSNLLVFDFELTASQVRNIKEITKMEVVDRVTVILEIFAKHAHTKEAKLQIEISRLQYLLPRLSSMWSHFSRQKGGGGAAGGASVRGGEGEQQLELDRRIIRERIEFYKKQLEDVEISRKEQSKRRQNKAITAALVGYTNAGKSSLMNRLCRVNVLEENKLFATLDATYRMLNPDTKPPMILIDTVGFISNLPNTLISGFRTTLESAIEADLLLIVCDASDPYYEKQLSVTMEVLKELKLEEKDKLIIFNKKDLLHDQFKEKIMLKNYPGSMMVSSLNPENMTDLRSFIINYFLDKQTHYDLFIPYEDGESHSKIMGNTNILNTVHHESGIFYRIRIPDFIFHSLKLTSFLLAPHDPGKLLLDTKI